MAKTTGELVDVGGATRLSGALDGSLSIVIDDTDSAHEQPDVHEITLEDVRATAVYRPSPIPLILRWSAVSLVAILVLLALVFRTETADFLGEVADFVGAFFS